MYCDKEIALSDTPAKAPIPQANLRPYAIFHILAARPKVKFTHRYGTSPKPIF
jgi:hypothetical protein